MESAESSRFSGVVEGLIEVGGGCVSNYSHPLVPCLTADHGVKLSICLLGHRKPGHSTEFGQRVPSGSGIFDRAAPGFQVLHIEGYKHMQGLID